MNYTTTSYSLPVAAICISIPFDTYLLRVGDTVVRNGPTAYITIYGCDGFKTGKIFESESGIQT